MSIYNSAANYDRKHQENSKIGLKNFQKTGNPDKHQNIPY